MDGAILTRGLVLPNGEKGTETPSPPPLSPFADPVAQPDRPVPMVRWSVPLVHHLVIGADALLLILAGRLAGMPPAGSIVLPTRFHAAAATVALALLTIVLLRKFDCYRLQRYLRPLRPSVDAVLALGAATAAAGGAVSLLAPLSADDKAWLAAWFLLSSGLLVASRIALRLLVFRGLHSGVLKRKVAIVGATAVGESWMEQLSRTDTEEPCEVVGVYDDRSAGRRPDVVGNVPVGGNIEALSTYAADHAVDLIVIALPWSRAVAIWSIIQRLQWISADVQIPLDRESFNPRVARVASLSGTPALQVLQQPFKGARGLFKLLEDYAVASVALLFTAPVMLVVALLVKLDSPGPILFRQPRYGFNRRPFQVLKFRTMRVDPTNRGTNGIARDDPRITRIGAFLRRTSLDELPQVLNVLRGDMSIVGPRPHVVGMQVGDARYTEAVREYAARHRIKPGITGWAQINGARGSVHTLDKAERVVDLDLWYIDNWSIWLDFRIMVRTLLTGMGGPNAY